MKKVLISFAFVVLVLGLFPDNTLAQVCDKAICYDDGMGGHYCDDPNCNPVIDASGNCDCQAPQCGIPGGNCCDDGPACNLNNYECKDGYCVYMGTGENQGSCDSNNDGEMDGVETAIGCIAVETPNAFISKLLTLAIGIGGGIAFLLMIFGAIQVLTSSGNPDKIQAGKELITSAIAGLLLIIFAVFILQLIAKGVLQIPGFT